MKKQYIKCSSCGLWGHNKRTCNKPKGENKWLRDLLIPICGVKDGYEH